MPAAPYSQDVLTRIYNVHWGGGTVFVYGTVLGDEVHWVKFADKTSVPEVRTVAKPVDKLGDACSSYASVTGPAGEAIAIFVINGTRVQKNLIDDGAGNIIEQTIYYPLICVSNDGLEWRKVYESPGGNGVNLVWNPETNLFYYDHNLGSVDRIFSSSDGSSWGMVSSTDSGDSPGYRSNFTSFCIANDCFDDLGQRVPDGVMRHDKNSDVTMKPVLPPRTFYWDGLHSFNISTDSVTYGSSEVEVTLPATDTTPAQTFRVSVPGIQKVTCVAGANGIWMVGGFAGQDVDTPGAVAFSVDNGATWTPLGSTTDGVVTMIAGAAANAGL